MTATTPRSNGALRPNSTLDFAERDRLATNHGSPSASAPAGGSPSPQNSSGWPLDDEPDPGDAYRDRTVSKAWGWTGAGSGRSSNVESAQIYQGTTTQVCGLFPFAVASGAAPRGVPVGRHLLTAEPVGLDPAEYLNDGLITNTGVWLMGQPGIGKSTIAKRLSLGLAGFGIPTVVPGDVKGEYTRLVEGLGGKVWRIGRGLNSLNPLDAGPLRSALRQTHGEVHARLLETVRARRLSLLEALIVIVRRLPMTVTERRLLGAALDLAVQSDPDREPTIPQVVQVLRDAPELLLEIAACATRLDFARDARDLLNTLGLLCDGAIRGIFDRPSTVTAELDAPALSLDISACADDDDEVVAAAMLCSWAWTGALIDGAKAIGAVRNVLRIQDELWRALRVAPGLVELSDRVTRLNRHRGEISIQVTHSLDDLEALPTQEDRMKARGMANRCGVVILGGMAERDIHAMSGISPMTDQEAALVRSWAAPPSWVSANGRAHPGRGKYLIKSGERMGIPVQMDLVGAERQLYYTDEKWVRGQR